MRGKVAKQLRREARELAKGLPERAYYETVEKTTARVNPLTKKLERVQSITIRVEPKTQRGYYKLLKKLKRISKGGINVCK
jgi:hypothetical protein